MDVRLGEERIVGGECFSWTGGHCFWSESSGGPL